MWRDINARVSFAAASALLLSLGCAAPGRSPVSPPGAAEGNARAVLDRFSAAVSAGRWDEAYPLLSARWRASATPSRLASDLAASGTVGRDAVERVRALLASGSPVPVDGDVATLPVAGDKAARLVREGGAWRVDALE
jgi:hypothetical protein